MYELAGVEFEMGMGWVQFDEQNNGRYPEGLAISSGVHWHCLRRYCRYVFPPLPSELMPTCLVHAAIFFFLFFFLSFFFF